MTPGAQVSRYRIVRPLGRGGMGEVFEAEDLRLGRRVALKFLPPAQMDEVAQKRFLNEARLAAQLRHPHICPIYDVDESEGRTFLAMALIGGETLAQRLKGGRLPLETVVRWSGEVLKGLEAAHAAGIIHRDIKSSNLMVDPEGHVTILDFGLAQRGGDERLTQVGYAIGTPAYMAPEQARGLPVDQRADLWALGVVMFEMLTGRLPEVVVRPPAEYRAGIPAALDQVVARALAANPEERWPSARAMRDALEAVPAAVLRPEETETKTTLAATPAKPSRARWAAVGAVAAVLLGWGVWMGREPAAAPVVTGAARRVALLPFVAEQDDARAVGDGLLEVMADALGEAERAGQKIWAVPVAEVRGRKLTNPAEARRVYGVDLAVLGEAEPAGASTKVTLKLVDTAGPKEAGREAFVYDPARPLASRELALEKMRGLLGLAALPERPREAVPPAADAYAAYLEGRGLMARYDRSGNLEAAIQRLARAVEIDPGFALAQAWLADAYWTKAKRANADPVLTKLALEHARRAVSLDSGAPLTHTKLGKILAETGEHEGAMAELRKALELAPGNADAARELAELLANQGRFAEAEKLYREAIRDRPTDWLGHLQLAFFLEDRARLAESEKELRAAGELAPENETVVRNLGRIFRMQGRYPEAVEQLLRGTRLQPSARAYNSLGVTYYLMHDYRKAVVAFEAAIELDGTAHQSWGNLGAAAAYSAEDKAKSAPALRKAAELAAKRIEVTPKLYSGWADLAEYRARLGDGAGARGALAKIPEASRGPLAGRIVVAYELSGKRDEALAAVRSYFTNPLTLREILDEPALAALRADARFAEAVAAVKAKAP